MKDFPSVVVPTHDGTHTSENVSVRSLDFSFNNVSYKLDQSLIRIISSQCYLKWYKRSTFKATFMTDMSRGYLPHCNNKFYAMSSIIFISAIIRISSCNWYLSCWYETHVCMNEEPLQTPLHSQVSFKLQLVIKFIFFKTHI